MSLRTLLSVVAAATLAFALAVELAGAPALSAAGRAAAIGLASAAVTVWLALQLRDRARSDAERPLPLVIAVLAGFGLLAAIGPVAGLARFDGSVLLLDQRFDDIARPTQSTTRLTAPARPAAEIRISPPQPEGCQYQDRTPPDAPRIDRSPAEGGASTVLGFRAPQVLDVACRPPARRTAAVRIVSGDAELYSSQERSILRAALIALAGIAWAVGLLLLARRGAAA